MTLRLLQEQIDLLICLVETDRAIPRDQRHGFFFTQYLGQSLGSVFTGGRDRSDRIDAAYQDIVALANANLLQVNRFDKRGRVSNFSITGDAVAYYEQLKQQEGQLMRQLEDEILRYLDSKDFQQRHQSAYHQWASAARILWSHDPSSETTTIGHYCREAMRALADDLAETFRPRGIADIKTPTARLRAIIEHQKDQLGSLNAFLEALIDYYYQVLQLGHRQEHGNQKIGDPLTQEDARRVVFQTAMVIFEVDRLLSTTQANNRYFTVRYLGPSDSLAAPGGSPKVKSGEMIELQEASIRSLLKNGHHQFDFLGHDL